MENDRAKSRLICFRGSAFLSKPAQAGRAETELKRGVERESSAMFLSLSYFSLKSIFHPHCSSLMLPTHNFRLTSIVANVENVSKKQQCAKPHMPGPETLIMVIAVYNTPAFSRTCCQRQRLEPLI